MGKVGTQPPVRRLADKDGPDFYPTAAWATHALMILERFPTDESVWEPACGAGDMSRVLEGYCPDTRSTDLYDRGYGTHGLDFTLTEEVGTVDNVITNPPFNRAEDFLMRGLQVARKRVALLQRLAWLEGTERYCRIFNVHPPRRTWVFSERLGFNRGIPDGGGSMVTYAWYVFDKEDQSGISELKWIPPGFKARFKGGWEKNPLEEFIDA